MQILAVSGVLAFMVLAGRFLSRHLAGPIARRRCEDATWIRTGVLARAYPRTEAEFSDLCMRGIQVVVNLHRTPHDPALLDRYGLSEVHLPVRDFHPPSSHDLERGVQAIEQARRRNQGVCVHCGAGKGRTGTLLACYLVRAEGIDAAKAIASLRTLRPGSIETRAQVRAIERFAAQWL